MQSLIKCLIVILLFVNVYYMEKLHAQVWQSLNGPLESDVRDIVIKNDSLYVGSFDGNGIFKKTYSNQWDYIEAAEGKGALRSGIEGLLSIEMDTQGNYYVGGYGVVNLNDGQIYQHFFMSNDYGKSWSEVRKEIEYCNGIEDIFITNNNNVLITCPNGIYKLVKNENKFNRVGNKYWPLNFFQHKDTVFAGTKQGLEYSVNQGETWLEIGTDTIEVHSISFSDKEFYIATNQGLYTTKKLDQIWNLLNNFPSVQINALYAYKNYVFAGTNSGAYLIRIEDHAVQSIFPILQNQSINTIHAFKNTLYIGSNTGLYTCNISQNTCTLNGVPNARIKTMTFHNRDSLLVGTTSNIYRYFLPVQLWDTLTVPIGKARSIITTNNTSFHIVNYNYYYNCSFMFSGCDSTNIDPGYSLFDLSKNSVGDLFLASTKRVFQSQDKGETWNAIYDNPDNNNRKLFPFSDSLLFINGNGLIKYSLKTGNYKILNIGVDYITSIGTIYKSAEGIRKSTDFGETWTTILQLSDVNEEDILTTVLYDETMEKLYAISNMGRVFVSDNEGINWGVNEDMYPISIETASVGADGTLYLGTSRAGIFRNTIPLNPPITISNEVKPSIPKSFILHQNYPNPFNPSTTISFELNKPEYVILKLYNIFGQEVFNQDLGFLNGGEHSHPLSFSNYASGMYLLKVSAGKNTQTIKMMFIK